MSQSVPPNREPEATPVGHSGIRVEIQERRAWAISGWFGVLVVAGCIVGAYFLANSSVKGVIAAPIVVATVIWARWSSCSPARPRSCDSSDAMSAPCAEPAFGGSCLSLTGGV